MNRSAMIRVIALIVAVTLPIVTAEKRSCSSANIPFLKASGDQCLNIYNLSGANLSFNVTFLPTTCFLFAAFNFTDIDTTNNWLPFFNACLNETGSLNVINDKASTGKLSSTKCLKYDILSKDSCDCHMDCLLRFEAGRRSYLYLEGINCNKTIFDTVIDTFIKDVTFQSNISWKDGFPTCLNTSALSSTFIFTSTPVSQMKTTTLTNLVPSPSTSITSTSLSTPVPTNVVTCDNLSYLNKTENYCRNCLKNINTSFTKLLNSSCDRINTSFHIKQSSQLNIFHCVQQSTYAILKQAFNSKQHCNVRNSWSLTCQCSKESQCGLDSPCLSSCILQFTTSSSDQLSPVSLLVSGLSNKEKKELLYNLTNLTQCEERVSSEGVEKECCSTIMSSSSIVVSSSPSLGVPSDDKQELYNNLYFQVGVGVIGGGLLCFLSSILVLCVVVARRRRRQAKFHPHLNATNKSYTTTSLPPRENGDHRHFPLPNTTLNSQVQEERVRPITDYSKWKRIFSKYLVHPSQIVVMETIGEGAFGLVQRGELITTGSEEKVEVAIKAMKDASTSEQIEEFISESAIMLDFDHPNVLRLLGVCFDTEDQLPTIILPYMANGDLKSFLQSKRRMTQRGTLPNGLSIPLLIRMCLDIARGMQYLAKKKFVHRDLAARNCMVDRELFVKVADFGLSRDVYSKDYYRLERRVKLPVKWLPPESLHDNIFNEKSDVWSFGVTCWEVFSLGKTPYPSIDNADVLQYIEKGLRLRKPGLCPKEMYLMLSHCWDESPEVRPCFLIIAESMQKVLTNWEDHTSSLLRQMEEELLLSCEQDEFDMNSMVDLTASTAVHGGSRSSLPMQRISPPQHVNSKKRFSQSSVSSIGKASDSHSRKSSQTMVNPLTPADTNGRVSLTLSSEDYPHIENYKFDQSHEYEEDGASSLLEYKDKNHSPESEHLSLNNFGRSLDGESTSRHSPHVPMFERFYEKSHTGQNSQHSPDSMFALRSMNLSGQSGEYSQSSNTTQETTLPDVTVMIPADYTSPVHRINHKKQKSSSTSRLSPLRQENIHQSTKSSNSNRSKSSSSRMTGETHLDSPSNHFYFTLVEPPPSATESEIQLPVFDGDSDSSEGSYDEHKDSIRIDSSGNNSASRTPILAYHISDSFGGPSLHKSGQHEEENSPLVVKGQFPSDSRLTSSEQPVHYFVFDPSAKQDLSPVYP